MELLSNTCFGSLRRRRFAFLLVAMRGHARFCCGHSESVCGQARIWCRSCFGSPRQRTFAFFCGHDVPILSWKFVGSWWCTSPFDICVLLFESDVNLLLIPCAEDVSFGSLRRSLLKNGCGHAQCCLDFFCSPRRGQCNFFCCVVVVELFFGVDAQKPPLIVCGHARFCCGCFRA